MPDSGVLLDNGDNDFEAATFLDGSSRHHSKTVMEYDAAGTPTKVADLAPMPVKERSVATLQNGVQVTVNTSATVLAAANANRTALMLTVLSGGPVNLGTTSVTTATGTALYAGDPPTIFAGSVCPVNEVRGIVAAGSATVLVQEITG